MKKILKETGLRDIKALAKRYPKAEIYFHQDLDGVTTAIAMKRYLEDNGIDVVGAHIIQYGDKEFAVKKNDAQGDVMPVLVDFAHGKPMFVIHTDHHDKQVGVEKGTPAHVKAGIAYNRLLKFFNCPYKHEPIRDGDKVKWVYLKTNPLGLDTLAFKDYNDPKEVMDFVETYIVKI